MSEFALSYTVSIIRKDLVFVVLEGNICIYIYFGIEGLSSCLSCWQGGCHYLHEILLCFQVIFFHIITCRRLDFNLSSVYLKPISCVISQDGSSYLAISCAVKSETLQQVQCSHCAQKGCWKMTGSPTNN